MKATEIAERVRRAWSGFLFAPFDLRVAAWLRIGFALLTLINFGVLGLDLEFWFGPDGPMPIEASRTIIDEDSHTIFEILPQTSVTLWICYGLLITHTVGLLVGFFPRFQAFGVFFWLLSFHNRHVMIFDGEDRLFRLFAFFMILLPTHRFHSVHAWWRKRRQQPEPARFATAWAFRLFQIQTTFVYVGAAWSKLIGSEWRDGIAMWYVTRLDDAWGKYPIPDVFFRFASGDPSAHLGDAGLRDAPTHRAVDSAYTVVHPHRSGPFSPLTRIHDEPVSFSLVDARRASSLRRNRWEASRAGSPITLLAVASAST